MTVDRSSLQQLVTYSEAMAQRCGATVIAISSSLEHGSEGKGLLTADFLVVQHARNECTRPEAAFAAAEAAGAVRAAVELVVVRIDLAHAEAARSAAEACRPHRTCDAMKAAPGQVRRTTRAKLSGRGCKRCSVTKCWLPKDHMLQKRRSLRPPQCMHCMNALDGDAIAHQHLSSHRASQGWGVPGHPGLGYGTRYKIRSI